MTERDAPELSAIFVTDRFESIRVTIEHVLDQTALDRMEVVIVAPSRHQLLRDAPELPERCNLQVVEVEQLESLPWGRAQGVRAATSPVVVLTETHSYPQPTWAEALIDAHRGPWAAVGPVLANGNPETSLSWAALMIAYGQWIEGSPAGEVEELPGHNSSYKRDLLLELGHELEQLMEVEAKLHARLKQRGARFYLEPQAKTDHVNISRPSSFVSVRFHSGRLFGAARGERLPAPRRWAYALAAPLIVLVRLLRFVRDLRRPGSPERLLPRIVPALLAGLVISSFAEALGCVSGPGSSTHGREDMELHREQHS